MDFGALLNLATTLAVVGGVVFAGWQLRLAAKARRTEISLHLMQTLHHREVTDGIFALLDVPSGLSHAELRDRLGAQWGNARQAWHVLDGLGLLVYRGEVQPDVADDFFKHAVAIVWEKMQAVTFEWRKEQGDTAAEWLQWLAESQAKRHAAKRLPAYQRIQAGGP